ALSGLSEHHAVMPAPIWPGVFGIARTMLRARGNTFARLARRLPARIESTSLPDARSVMRGSRPASCCGLQASTMVSAGASNAARSGGALAPVRAARAAAVPSPPSVQARSAGGKTFLARTPSTMAEAIRPAPRKAILGIADFSHAFLEGVHQN